MKRYLWVLLILLGTGFSGCSREEETRGMIQEMDTENTHVLTKEQEEFLKLISVNKKRIEEGRLYDWQEKILNQYKEAEAYLEGKYPGTEFRISGCEMAKSEKQDTVFYFVSEGIEEVYEAHVSMEESPEGSVALWKDNFYGRVLEEPYERRLLELLKEQCSACMAVDTSMTTVQGEEWKEGFDIEKLLDGSLQLTNQTVIYLVTGEAGEAGKLAEEIESVIRERKIYGSYIVYVFPENAGLATAADFQEAAAKNEYIQEKTFQEFY